MGGLFVQDLDQGRQDDHLAVVGHGEAENAFQVGRGKGAGLLQDGAHEEGVAEECPQTLERVG